MNTKAVIRSKNVLNAIYIGTLCSVAYLAVYFARNLLGAVTPEMLEGGYTEQYIGKVSSASSFIMLYLIKQPVLNIILIIIAIMSSNGAATMLWSRYCPGLRDTGMVSTATGFLDFISYIAAAASSAIFANIVSVIGWGNLILVWFGLMLVGVIVALPYNKIAKKWDNLTIK